MSSLITAIIIIALAIFFFSLLVRIIKAPIKLAGKFLIHMALGYVALFVFNFVGAWVGISIGTNWVNAAVTGILGVPGVILLLLIKYIF